MHTRRLRYAKKRGLPASTSTAHFLQRVPASDTESTGVEFGQFLPYMFFLICSYDARRTLKPSLSMFFAALISRS